MSRWLEQTETWLYTQLRFLPEDVESYVICETTTHLDQFPVGHIHSLEEVPGWRAFLDKGLRRIGLRTHLGFLISETKRCGADILHSHFGNIGWKNLHAARKAGVKHVVTFYGFDLSFLPQREPVWFERYREMFPSVDRVLCEGPHMAEKVAELGCPREKIQVHHLGVDVDEIRFQPRFWQPGETLSVLIAGSFKEKKGIPFALEALGALQGDVSLKVTVIGDAGHEERSRLEKKRILETIAKRNLGERVRMLGYTTYERFFEEAYGHHIFLSPSVTASDGDTEGGAPVSLIDMAATGRVLVSTRHCDIPEVVLHGKTGLLAEERNVDELVEHLHWLIDNPDKWKAMVTAGRSRIETEFNARVQGRRLADIYSEIL